jgi:hypothetical protein
MKLRRLILGSVSRPPLVNPTNSVAAESTTKDVGTAAAGRGRQVDVVKAATARDIKTAFGKGANQELRRRAFHGR